MLSVTKEFSFEMAHLLDGYDGLCSQIHGHSYRMFVCVEGVPCSDNDSPKRGMILDFGVLKKLVNEVVVDIYDHSLVVGRTANNGEFIETLQRYLERIIVVDYQPTCELMVENFALEISKRLPENIRLKSVKLYETATSFAKWEANC